MKRHGWVVAILIWTVAGCGGEGDIGEECDASGATEGECVGGLICGKASDSSDVLVCLRLCADQDECASDEDCNGIEGTSLKGCRLKD